MATAVAPLPIVQSYKGKTLITFDQNAPLEIRGNAILVNPAAMVMDEYYCLKLNGNPYMYRKTADNEIEVYGLAQS